MLLNKATMKRLSERETNRLPVFVLVN